MCLERASNSASRWNSVRRTVRHADRLDTGGDRCSLGIVINPAGHSFTSIALLDALKVFRWPVVEVHISNMHRREPHYQRSYVSYAATGVIAGLGAQRLRAGAGRNREMLREGEPAR